MEVVPVTVVLVVVAVVVATTVTAPFTGVCCSPRAHPRCWSGGSVGCFPEAAGGETTAAGSATWKLGVVAAAALGHPFGWDGAGAGVCRGGCAAEGGAGCGGCEGGGGRVVDGGCSDEGRGGGGCL